MSIIDDTFRRLGEEHSRRTGNPASRKHAADFAAEIGFVAGPGKRRPSLLLPTLVFAAVCVAIYFWLHKTQSPSVPSQPLAAIAEQQSKLPVISQPQPQPQPQSQSQQQEMIPPQPPWYQDGWSAASAGKWPDALMTWEDGLRGLPSDRTVIAANSYIGLKVFQTALSKYARQFPAVGVRQNYNGKMVYRLVVYPYGGGTSTTLTRVQTLFPRAGLANASYLKGRLAEASGSKTANENAAIKLDGRLASAVAENTGAKVRGSAGVKALEKPANIDGAYLSTVSRMLVDTANAASNGAAEAATVPVEWGYRSHVVREQISEEAYAEAARNAESLTHDFPDRWASWFWLGTAQLALGQLDAAGAALEHASALNPKVPKVWVQRAVVAQQRGDNEVAVKLLNEALNLSPKSPQVYLNLGYSSDALGQSAEAEKYYQDFLSLTEGNAAYLLQRTLVIERLERNQ